MYKMKDNIFSIFVCFITIFIFITTQIATVNATNALFSDTTVAHRPVKYFVPDHRIVLNVMVKDSTGIDIVRCYFKEANQPDFSFVRMESIGHDTYQCLIPKPSDDTMSIQYRFLIVNNISEIIDTQTYTIHFFESDNLPEWQVDLEDSPIYVYTDLSEKPGMLFGFSDNIEWNVVSASDRYGFTADGLYSERSLQSVELAEHKMLAPESTSDIAPPMETKPDGDESSQPIEVTPPVSAPAKARTVTATEKPSSTGKLLGIGVLGAAVVAGAAAAGGGGGGGGGGDDGGVMNADLALSSLSVTWNNPRPGSNPSSVSYLLHNHGPQSLTPPNTRVYVEFFVSRTGNVNNAIRVGTNGYDFNLRAGSQMRVYLSSHGRSWLRWPGNLSSGMYYFHARVHHESPPSQLRDPSPGNNDTRSGQTIRYR